MNIYNQSAVIPFKEIEGKLQILLITTLKKKKWIIPKGIIEDNMTAMESAQKEALEEAGITGLVSSKIYGNYTQEKWNGVCRITVYAMKVDKELKKWAESKMRKRRWFSAGEAPKQISKPELKKIVSNFASTYTQSSG